jgi:hypothetical protein
MMVTGDGGLPVRFGRPTMKKKRVLFFLAIMVTGEGGLPIGFAVAFSFFFFFFFSGFVFCFHLKFVRFS